MNASLKDRMAMYKNYCVRIQPVLLGPSRSFQVRIGMDGDHGLDYIPVHCSAFAGLLQLAVTHPDIQTASMEAQMIAEYLGCGIAQ